MAGKSWSASTNEGEIIPANKWRNTLLIQSYSDNSDSVFIQIGQSAETDKGIELTGGSSYTVRGQKAKLSVHGVMKSNTATGGYEET